jgi:hypothetical protein
MERLMVKASFFALAVCTLTGGCSGRSAAEGAPLEVETPGTGRYDRIMLNAGVIVSDGSIHAFIPQRVKINDTVSVSFSRDGKKLTHTLVVTRISQKGTLCRLHTTPERVVGNTIYVRPCKVLLERT